MINTSGMDLFLKKKKKKKKKRGPARNLKSNDNWVPFITIFFLLSLNLTSSSVVSFCVEHIQVMVPVGIVQVCQNAQFVTYSLLVCIYHSINASFFFFLIFKLPIFLYNIHDL